MGFLQRRSGFIMRALGLAICVCALVSFSSWAAVANAQDAETKAQIQEAERLANRGPYANDGTFEGEAEGFGGMVRVAVTIDNGYIDKVEILSAEGEDEAWMEMAIVLLDTIVDEQTTQVDVISGATFTSSGILNGATNALLAMETSGSGE